MSEYLGDDFTKRVKVSNLFGGGLRLGSCLLAFYASIAIFTHLFVHGINADAGRAIIDQFGQRFPNATASYESIRRSTYSTVVGIEYGFLASVLVFLPILLIANSAICASSEASGSSWLAKYLMRLRRTSEYLGEIVVGTIVLTIYIAVYLAVSGATNPYLVNNFGDIMFAIEFAAISGNSAFLYIYFARRSRLRREPLADSDVQLRVFELEHSSMQQLLNILSAGIFVFLVGLVITPWAQLIFSTPGPMAASPPFGRIILTFAILVLVVASGFWLGVWTQTYWQSQDIIDAAREFGRKKSFKES